MKTKQILVDIVPSCISSSRELQHIKKVKQLYRDGLLNKNKATITENENAVIITYWR